MKWVATWYGSHIILIRTYVLGGRKNDIKSIGRSCQNIKGNCSFVVTGETNPLEEEMLISIPKKQLLFCCQSLLPFAKWFLNGKYNENIAPISGLPSLNICP